MPRGPTGRRPHTRARLKAAALEEFAEHGYPAGSIARISDRAGLTRGAFYSNFATKDELFFELFDDHSDATLTRVLAAFEERIEQVDPLTAIADAIATLVPDDERWFVVSTEFTLHAIRTPEAAAVLARHDARIRDEIAAFLGKAFERAGWTVDVDLDRVARLIVAVREGGLAQSMVEPAVLRPGELDRWFLTTFLPGLRAQPG